MLLIQVSEAKVGYAEEMGPVMVQKRKCDIHPQKPRKVVVYKKGI